METDDFKRNRRGVVCTLVLNDQGRARLVMDDVESSTDTAPQTWRGKVLFTWMNFTEEEFLPVELSESQLADIGLALVSRLAVFELSRREKKP